MTIALWIGGYFAVACATAYLCGRLGMGDEDDAMAAGAFWPLALLLGAIVVPMLVLVSLGKLGERHAK